jgi:diguanylate cyclase (GGDEF)-like protein/PAS domain S-box-containing protein
MDKNEAGAVDSASAADLLLLATYCTDVIARLSPDMRIRYISPSSERLFLRPVTDSIGHHIAEFMYPEDLPVVQAATARLLAGEVDHVTVTVRAVRGDGTLVWVEVTSQPIGTDALGQLGDRAVVMRDITERKALEDQLTAMAMKDGLTGLANRRAFDEALQRCWLQTLREGSQMSLLLLDVDCFKQFNDSYGHQVGDDCLRAIAATIQSGIFRPMDTAARYGGEEMAVILPGTDMAGAVEVAGRLRDALADLRIPHECNDAGQGFVSASIGVATAVSRSGGSSDMPDALLTAADRALYKAKSMGRNRVETAMLLAARPLRVLA